jgi:glucuronosyltransferase
MPIVRALTQRNHHVTIVTSHPQEEYLENVHDIVVPNPYMNDGKFDWFAMNSINPLLLQFHIFSNFATISKFNYEALMNNPEFIFVLKSREIDLVILDDSFNDFCLKIIENLKVPFIYFSSSTGYPWVFNSMGVSQELSSIPSRFTGYDSTMNFKQRLVNTLAGLGSQILRRFLVVPAIDAYAKKDFPLARSISDIEKEASLYFLSSQWATTWPRSVPPTIIQLGPLHIRPPQPLPQVM